MGSYSLTINTYFMNATEIKTLEQLAQFVNENEDWNLEVNDIIKANGWKDNTYTNYGVCATDYAEVVLSGEDLHAEVIKKSDVDDVEFNHKTSYLSYTINGIDFWAQGEFARTSDGEHFIHTHFCGDESEVEIIFD